MRSLALFTALVLASTTAIAAHEPGKHHTELSLRQIDSSEFDGFWVEDDDDDEGWQEVDISLLMERDVTPAEASSLMKRDGSESTRDLGSTDYAFPINERGELVFPRSWDQVKNAFQTVSRRTFHYALAKITWYAGSALRNPACWNKSRWQPSDSSLIAAVTQDWKDKPECGTWLKIRPSGSSRSVVVREWDLCHTCPANVPHVDLTKGGFSKLFSLSKGTATKVSVKSWYKPFKGSWDSKMVALYGPEQQ